MSKNLENMRLELKQQLKNSKEYQEAHSILKGYAVRQHQTVEGA